MKVEAILEAKGRAVETVAPDAGVEQAIRRLATLGIGALVVSRDGATIEGVFGERDVVRALARHGPHLAALHVADVMSRSVPACSPRDSIKRVMETMTRSRHRHLPVVDGGRLGGIVSIGDIVKHRLEEAELEANVLRDAYLSRR